MSSLAVPLPGFDRASDRLEHQHCQHCSGLGTLTATDVFCGAGGSSNGLEHVKCPHCGRSLIVVVQALNHWDLAVQAHNANFPHADHDVHDVELVPATRFSRTDVAWFSPGCGDHAYCRGPKRFTDDALRSRATFMDIVRWTAHHRYDVVFVENVIEARHWCDTRGHSKKCKCGSHFNAWFNAMTDLGYEGRIVYFNSQFASVPQSRDRMYIAFWRTGVRTPALDFQPMSWCTSCNDVVYGIQTWKTPSKGGLRSRKGMFEWGRYGTQYTYSCPHCSNTVAPAVRPARTIIDWTIEAEPIGARKKPLAENTYGRIRRGFETVGRYRPMQVAVGGNLYERPGSGYARVWSVDTPLRAVTTRQSMGLVTPAGGQKAEAKDVEQPTHTILGNDRLGVVLRYGGQSEAARRASEPMSTITAHDRQIGLVVPNMTNCVGADTEQPIGAVTTGNRHMLVALRRNTRPVDTAEPAQTVTAGGYHHGLLVYNGNPGFVRDLDDAAGTVTTRDKQSLLVPYNRTGNARPAALPTGTLTTHDREALVIPEEITDDFIDACHFRMLQWPELLAAQTMDLRPDGQPYLLTARTRDKRGRMKDLSNEDRVKMIGNAVSSHVATELGWSAVEALA